MTPADIRRAASSRGSSATEARRSPSSRATTASRRSRSTATSSDWRADGLIERVHGGARPPGSGPRELRVATDWTKRLKQGLAAKQAIAARAAEFVEDGSTIFVDSSTTCLVLARHLERHPPRALTLVTNSPAIALELQAQSIHVVVTPGEVDQTLRMIGGRWAAEFLAGLNIETAFVSAGGVTLEQGLTTTRRALADTLNAASASSTKTHRASSTRRSSASPHCLRSRVSRSSTPWWSTMASPARRSTRSRRPASTSSSPTAKRPLLPQPPKEDPNGTSRHALHRPVGRSPAGGARREGRRLGLRRTRARLLGRSLRRRRGAGRRLATPTAGASSSTATACSASRSATHLVGQAVCDPIDDRHRAILPPDVWGDGEPEGVRAARGRAR